MDRVDKIFYINLDIRKDRLEHINEQFKILEISEEKTERVQAIHVPKYGCLGCAQSHIKTLKLAQEREYENIIILEDDFKAVRNRKLFDECINWLLDNRPTYDICLMSYNMHDDQPIIVDKFLRKALKAQTTSGYIINKKYYQKLIDCFSVSAKHLEKRETESQWAIDIQWKQLQLENPEFLAFKHRLGVQIHGFSDIRRTKIYYNC